MKRAVHLFIALIACIPVLLWADDDKYLAGAVPEVGGKVVFSKEFNMQEADQNAVYDRVHNWLDSQMKANENDSRIVYADKEKGQIVASVEKYLIFSSMRIAVDRSLMSYTIVFLCKPGKCEMQIDRIRFDYDDKKYTAEKMIADKISLNKKKTSMIIGYKKFRISAIDYFNEIFESARTAFDLKD